MSVPFSPGHLLPEKQATESVQIAPVPDRPATQNQAAESTQTAPSPDDLLTRHQAADYMGMASQTLAVWASTGRYGLRYIRIGRLARYRRRDLDEFMARRTITSTSQLD